MNRHHYALYVHNCRLVFLLRKDFDQADTFRPAEFHWKLDQVWHSPHPAPQPTPLRGGRCAPVMTERRHVKVLLAAEFGKHQLREPHSILKSR